MDRIDDRARAGDPKLFAVAAPTLAIRGDARRFPLRRVFCIGRNYWWPDAGAPDARVREAPFFFMKPADTVVDASGTLAYPPRTGDFCPEIELVVAIGRGGADIAVADALTHVWGYAAGLDLTRRDRQTEAKAKGRPWDGAKAFDASAPCTPLRPVADGGHPSRGAIWLTVNDAERQRSDVADLIWPVAELIAFLSRWVALAAGDLIFTGTPPGVGALEPGDVVRAGVDGIGELTVTVGAR